MWDVSEQTDPDLSSRQRTGRARLLVVDDEEDLRAMLVRTLSADGFLVDLTANPPDLVVLDVMLPAEDGLELLARIRRTSEVPVILLTGRGHENDRILGLKLGADDYVTKPFSPGELSARITTILRRTKPATKTTKLEFGPLAIDATSREVSLEGQVVEMTAKEFDLLAFLASSPRQVFSREQLLRQVWDSSSEWQDAATVTEHVRRVRRKIEEDPDSPRWIRTVRGVGYRFEP